MLTASDTFQTAQPRLRKLVRRSEQQTGSRMLAYESVARRIGSTPSWIRKFLGNQPVAEPSYSVVHNIIAAYHDACQHWDDVAAEERRRFFELGEAEYELADEAAERLGVEAGSAEARARGASGLVSHVVDAERERLTADDPGRPASWRGVRR